MEHFNTLNQALGRNADLLIAIGEEIIVTRRRSLGHSHRCCVHHSLRFRKMAHTAEEVTATVLYELYGLSMHDYYSADIRNGYVLKFNEKPNLDFDLVEERILEIIRENRQVDYYDDLHIRFGDVIIPLAPVLVYTCALRVRLTIFLHKELVYDERVYQAHCLIGLIGDTPNHNHDLANRNTDYFLRRHE